MTSVYVLEENKIVPLRQLTADDHLSYIRETGLCGGQYTVCSLRSPAITHYFTRKKALNDEGTKLVTSEGSSVHFFIRANPARHKTQIVGSKTADKTIAILQKEYMKHWLIQKLADNGLDASCVVCSQSYTESKAQSQFINTVWFEGTAKVLSETKYRDLILNGLGRERKYGFGMFIPSNTQHYELLSAIHSNENLH